MSGVRRALAFSFLERYLLLAIGLGSNMAIARLLTPEAIGIYSVSLAFISVAQVLRDFGVANYLIQERDLRQEHVRTAFGVLLVLGGGVFVALNVATPLIARLYGEPAMISTLRIASLNFLALPFCTVSLALLRRSMKFKQLALVNFIAAVAGAAVSVGMAAFDQGVISLAVGAVVLNVVTGVGAWVARSDSQVLLPAFSQWRKVLNFGAQSSLAGVVTSISMDINDLAVGKIMGFQPVAMLSRAQGLMNLFHRDLMSAVRNVAFPAYAKAAREGAAMEPLYVTSVTFVTAVAWPFYGFVSLYALEILRLLFGSQWDEAVPLVPVFCLAGAVAATTNLAANLMLAVGRVELVTRVELVFQPFRAALIVVAALYFKSMMACAVALVIAMLVLVPYLYWEKGRCVPNNHAALRRGLGASLVVAALALMIPAALRLGMPGSPSGPNWWQFGVAAASCIACWIAGLIWLKHPLAADPAFQRVLAMAGRLHRRQA